MLIVSQISMSWQTRPQEEKRMEGSAPAARAEEAQSARQRKAIKGRSGASLSSGHASNINHIQDSHPTASGPAATTFSSLRVLPFGLALGPNHRWHILG